ncbi:MAG: response regulator [Planctomycetia bacterium]|nr:response regulator [Planctomycetia bacterium]
MRVLIADDEPVSRKLLQSYLQKWGYEVTAAQNGAEAWRLFQESSFSIVITDWMMPEVDGLELIRRIRAANHSGYVHATLLTAKAQKEDLVEGMEAGADDFLTKPFDRDELRVRLRAAERIVKLEQSLAEQNRVLRETQSALVQNEKLASLGRLAAGVAHEINNPIAYVTNNLAVIRRDTQSALAALDAHRRGDMTEAARLEQAADIEYLRENFSRTCDKTLEGLQRVRDIVRNLRDFARLDEAEFKEANLNAALESTLEIVGHQIREKSIQLEKHFGELPLVLCHPGKINQVFLNLLVNAIQACDRGGVVIARTRAEPGSGVVVEVQDNGCGIRPEHRERLFEPFFTTKPVGQGTGLGLSVSFGIVRDHGGSIEVDSEVGRGSTFRVVLPLKAIGKQSSSHQ